MGRSKRSAITASANGLETLLFDAIEFPYSRCRLVENDYIGQKVPRQVSEKAEYLRWSDGRGREISVGSKPLDRRGPASVAGSGSPFGREGMGRFWPADTPLRPSGWCVGSFPAAFYGARAKIRRCVCG